MSLNVDRRLVLCDHGVELVELRRVLRALARSLVVAVLVDVNVFMVDVLVVHYAQKSVGTCCIEHQ
jgi:hypothetical protein